MPLDANSDGRDYDVNRYTAALVSTYASRLRTGLAPSDFGQVFDASTQPSLFDRPFHDMHPIWTPTTTS